MKQRTGSTGVDCTEKRYTNPGILASHISFHCASYILQKKKKFLMEGLWQPCVKPVYGCHFSNSICSVGVSVSNLVILPVFPMLSQMIQFAMVIYGQ